MPIQGHTQCIASQESPGARYRSRARTRSAARVQVALEVQRLPVGDAQVDLCRILAGELDPDRVLLVAAVDRRGPETVDLGDRAPETGTPRQSVEVPPIYIPKSSDAV